MERTYTTKEVQNLIEPLFKQIEFYQNQYHKCEKYILLPWYKKLFTKWEFIRSLMKDEDESETPIEELVRFARKNPEGFQFLKEFYDRKSPKYN